jgi:Immunity protein Imm1
MGERARFRLSVDGKDAEVRSLAELHRRLAEGTASEIWLTRRDGQALSLLVSGDRGWLMFLREAGDAGFSSRGADAVARRRGTLPFRLSNGQVDEHPVRWTVPIEDALRVVEHFFEHGERAPFIRWHAD